VEGPSLATDVCMYLCSCRVRAAAHADPEGGTVHQGSGRPGLQQQRPPPAECEYRTSPCIPGLCSKCAHPTAPPRRRVAPSKLTNSFQSCFISYCHPPYPCLCSTSSNDHQEVASVQRLYDAIEQFAPIWHAMRFVALVPVMPLFGGFYWCVHAYVRGLACTSLFVREPPGCQRHSIKHKGQARLR
jgi:hypothetical protein